MGGTKILASAVNSSEGIIASVKYATDLGKGSRGYIKDIVSIIKDVIKKGNIQEENVAAVCLGVPGAVNPHTGIIAIAPNLGLKNFNIKEKLQALIPFPVLIENDVNLGALGIKYSGIGKKAKNLLAVFLGTGIGGGLIIDDKIYRGSGFVAGEIGHIVVDKNGPVCGCGNKGCFEALASRTAIANKIISDLKKNKQKSSLNIHLKSGEKIKSKALAAAIQKKDKVVIKNITEACQTIGIVLSGIANTMNFDMIVLGGGLIEALDYFMLPLIKEEFNKHVMKATAKGLKIVASSLGDDAAIYGGIALAEEFVKVKV